MSKNSSLAEELLPGYCIRHGSSLDRALLVKFMQLTYQEMFPSGDFSHLARTVEQYFSSQTPLWWVEEDGEVGRTGGGENIELSSPHPPITPSPHHPVACLWMGNAINQVTGDRHAHIFLLYVVPEHRRRGIGTALMQYAEDWAKKRGDRQMGLQVFQSNQAALGLYNHLGYQTQSLWMVKSLYGDC
ncbi:GNAT family N-acetyltransferase [Fischerella sp.]|uniref:GNAT family N-acetyltransferase n=1 Tax=Fischerella sp. TaxID=1191 RepID=UPI0025C17EBD|nr:GNAT family N-acetyltransferase [Fischerella sp.]